MTATCENCRYWKRWPEPNAAGMSNADEWGECKLAAPRAVAVPDSEQDEIEPLWFYVRWPKVHMDDWCGQWSERAPEQHEQP